jgi:hypothetical protein
MIVVRQRGILMRAVLTALAAVCASAAPAAAQIVERSEDHFVLRYELALEAAPGDFADAVDNLPLWWNPSHTYSGDSANLSLDLDPGTCFCEALDDGSVFEHGAVYEWDPETGVLLHAALGPLNGRTEQADWSFGWAGSTLTMTYVVRGPGVGAFADPVDRVMGEAFGRMTHFIHYGEAPASAE